MKILADLHHSGLYHSLKLLLEDRLGHKLFRPVGLEWFEQGYWDIARPYGNNSATVEQYLSLTPAYTLKDQYYEIEDPAHSFKQKALTLEQFKQTDIDVIIASIPDHWYTYTKLRDIYKPTSKVVCHMGNMFNEIEDTIKSGVTKNLLSSTIPFPVTASINACFYHQEFPLEIFSYTPPSQTNMIRSFVHLFPRLKDYGLYTQLKEALPDFTFENYGSLCDNGILSTQQALANAMKQSTFILHLKEGGDGFGHVLFNSAAVGRPLIVKKNYYTGQLGSQLMIDGQTCITVDNKSISQIKAEIQAFSQPTAHAMMCRQVYENFRKYVNFEHDAEQVKTFLSYLI